MTRRRRGRCGLRMESVKINGCRGFTLVEAVVALLILSLGLGVLISQFALAGARIAGSRRRWEISHELTNAAEYVLSSAPDCEEALPERFAGEGFSVARELRSAVVPEEFEKDNGEGALRLVSQHIELCDAESGEVLDTLEITSWTEAEYAP